MHSFNPPPKAQATHVTDRHADTCAFGGGSNDRTTHSLPLPACIFVAVLISSASAQQPPNPPMLSPQDALAAIEMIDGFQVELVAAEPLVQDPVNFDWGPDGKLWVVEMADYPLGLNGTGKPGGRIKVLEDDDGDGVYDRSTLFADGLNTPTGIMVWRNGVLVSGAPDITYLEDTTGDGKADKRKVLFTGFAEGNQQHRVNGFCWGLDNWVYLANGDSGGRVKSTNTGGELNINGRDLRIWPDTGEMQTQSGRTQFGRNRDDWGNWFGCNNPNPIFHFVMDEQYLQRNPHAKYPSSKRDIRHGSVDVFPIGPIISHCDTKYRPIGAKPKFTSACGVMPYRDNLFGPEYENVTFTSEPVYNIIHARKLVPDGVTFRSEKLHGESEEFFRSKDPWCRPTALHVGPDGTLYVADMVREVLEHPEWIDDKLEVTLDLYNGSDRGRIYRISPIGSKRRPVPDLSDLTTAELVSQLDSPNGCQRDLVQRMLIWRDDAVAVEPLKKLYAESENPLARLHALCSLDGLEELTVELIRSAMKDEVAGIRRHAIRLSEQFDINWRTEFTGLLSDPDPQVRLQLACTLGDFSSHWTASLLRKVAVQSDNDPYVLAAVVSSFNEANLPLLFLGSSHAASLHTPQDAKSDVHRHLLPQLVKYANATGRRDLIDSSLSSILINTQPDKSGQYFSTLTAVLDVASVPDGSLDQAARKNLHARFEEARETLKDKTSPVSLRVAAAGLLLRDSAAAGDDLELIGKLLNPKTPPEVSRALVERAADSGQTKTAASLLAGWKSHSPSLRSHILSVIASRERLTAELVHEISQQRVAVADIDPVSRQTLLTTRNKALRDQLNAMFSVSGSASRQEVVERFKSAVELKGNLENGHKLFKKTCASCHRLGDIGTHVGPNLAALTNKSPEALLVAILDPGRAVEAKYVGYTAITDDGRTHSGLLAEESDTSITLLAAEGKRKTLLRNELEELVSTSKSMMPEGLEKELKPQDLADLIAFVVSEPAASN